jgi:hypothetical protein
MLLNKAMSAAELVIGFKVCYISAKAGYYQFTDDQLRLIAWEDAAVSFF